MAMKTSSAGMAERSSGRPAAGPPDRRVVVQRLDLPHQSSTMETIGMYCECWEAARWGLALSPAVPNAPLTMCVRFSGWRTECHVATTKGPASAEGGGGRRGDGNCGGAAGGTCAGEEAVAAVGPFIPVGASTPAAAAVTATTGGAAAAAATEAPRNAPAGPLAAATVAASNPRAKARAMSFSAAAAAATDATAAFACM